MTSLMLCVLCFSPAAAQDKKTPDYQAKADMAKWEYSAAKASLELSKKDFPKAYMVEGDPPPDNFGSVTIKIKKDGKDIYSWNGHKGSVFLALGDVLYYADYHMASTGCTLIAVDLATGKQLWKTPLKGLGPIRHFRYTNSVNLATEDMNTLRIFSRESAGGYVEYVDRKTGKTVGHRTFKGAELNAK